MGESDSAPTFASVLRDRWQMPVALLAVGVGALTGYTLLPQPIAAELPVVLADVTFLEESGATQAAADALGNLLADPSLPAAEQARLHDRLAELIYRTEQQRKAPEPRNAALVLEHHDAAVKLGYPPDPHRALRAAQAAEWAGSRSRAVPAYRAVLEEHADSAQRRSALTGLLRLLADDPEAAEERAQFLDNLLADEGLESAELWWALQQATRDALVEDDLLRAQLLVGKSAPHFATSDRKGFGEHLWAWLLVHEGRTEEARPLVDWVDEWLVEHRPVEGTDPAYDELAARNRCLLGRIQLALGAPDQAREAFDEAAGLAPDPDTAATAVAGRGLALAALGDHTGARTALRDAAAKASGPAAGLLRRELRRELERLVEVSLAGAARDTAIGYLEDALALAPLEPPAQRLALLEKLGTVCEAAADAADDDTQAAVHGRSAGEYREAAADLTSDPDHAAELLWAAVRSYESAGAQEELRRAVSHFLQLRTEDPRLAQACLIMARSYADEEDCPRAVLWCIRVGESFPGLDEGLQAQLLRARCLVALGYAAEAEALLLDLLEGGQVAPQAVVFRDALLELCELLYLSERYGEAIARLDSFLNLYPTDPEGYRVQFLTADAYRRSAVLLRAAPAADSTASHATLAAERFTRAGDAFAALERDLSSVPGRPEPLRSYERLSLLYAADCLDAAGDDPDTVLAAYQRVLARYEHDPLALAAHVQMANIHLRAGRAAEAARAIGRARWLLPMIPEEAFAAGSDLDRAHWERYLATLWAADLFQNALAGAP